MGTWTRWFIATILVLILSPSAVAFTHTEHAANTSVTVYAPDWTWQKRDVNILIILRNEGARSDVVTLDVAMPSGMEDHFSFGGESVCEVEVPPGGLARASFAGIVALDHVRPQDYVFEIGIAHHGSRQAIAYPLKTIRGAAVRPGKWALYLPVGVALLWCVVFAGVLGRMAPAGAWRKKRGKALPDASAPPWVDEEA